MRCVGGTDAIALIDSTVTLTVRTLPARRFERATCGTCDAIERQLLSSISVTLYEHLLDYGLARTLASNETIKPGDLNFYSWNSTAPSGISHVQVVAGRTSRGVTVAQHSKNYVRLLSEVMHDVTANEGAVGADWDFWVLRPTYTAANIG
jgi:hypothetical protein